MEQERRQHARITVRVPLYVELPSGLFRKPVAIEARSVSKSGLSFETQQEIPEGAEARLMLARLGNLQDEAQIEATVVYCRRTAGRESWTVGVRFLRLVSVTAEELVARLEAAAG